MITLKTTALFTVLLGLAVAPAFAAESLAPANTATSKATPTQSAPPAKATTEPTKDSDEPTTDVTEPSVPADVAAVLDKMDAVGKDIKTVTAKFDFELNQTAYDDKQKRKGEFAYQAPNHLRLTFTDTQPESYIFDGRNFYQKKDGIKQLTIWQVQLDSEPELAALTLGKTPFPLPFGQRGVEILKEFTVTRDGAAEKEDKEGRKVLTLVPKAGTALASDYAKIMLWIEPKSCLPTRVRLFGKPENTVTFDFTEVQKNKEIDTKTFTRPEVPKDWQVTNHPKESEQDKGTGDKGK